MESKDQLLNEMIESYEKFTKEGKTVVRWEDLPSVIRAYIKSKVGVKVNAIDIGAFRALIYEYEKELDRKGGLDLELTEEEREAMREAIKEVEAEFEDPTIVGSNKYKEVVDGIAKALAIYEDKEIKPAMVAELLLGDFYFVTFADTEELYYYSRGAYRPGGEVFVKIIIEDIFRVAGKLGRLSTYFVNEVLGHIRRSTLKWRSEFDKDPYVINVKNGLLDLRTMELIPHDPDYLSVIQLPVEWNPKAKCPRWDKFISEIVNEEDAKALQEFTGYLLFKDCRFQKALMLTGSGANGKTTFLNVITKLLGSHNCAFRSLQELTTNRFATADLYGKLANIYDDLPPETLVNTGIFKILVSGSEIQAEKKFKDTFKFKNFAKLVFSANQVPSTMDNTRAFFRRWVLINFPNVFEGDRKDPDLEEKLSTPECLSYVLKWAVEGLRRLLKQKAFSYDERIDEIEDRYMRASNPSYAFFQDCVEEGDSELFVVKDELYRAFKEYCRKNKLPTVTKRTFSEHVKRWTKAQDGWAKIQGKAVRVWRGIRLKSDNNENSTAKEGVLKWIEEK